MAKNFNPNLAKIHRSYTVEEVANLYGIHKNTVRTWTKKHGLKTNDELRPTLILGHNLRSFMQEKRIKNKCECLPHEVYCLKCRKPQTPAGNMADYLPISNTTGRLISLCPECGSLNNQYKRLDQIQAIKDKLAISFPEGTKTHNQED